MSFVTDTTITESLDIIEDDFVTNSHSNDVVLTTMFFTETSSSEDGFYYVFRSGVDAIAYFGASTVTYFTENTFFTVEFPGSNLVIPQGESPTGSVTNYFLGNDPSEWKTGIEDCSVLRYREIYPGIDLVYKIHNGNLKYEFVVAPGANPELIQMSYPDASMIDVSDAQVTVSKSDSSFSDTGLWVFQGEEETVDITCAFQTQGLNTVGFNVGSYDESQELVIDPLLVYSTFLGGLSDDAGNDIVVDDGYIYLTGYTKSAGFPTENAFNSTHSGNADCFVIKLAADGQSLIYSTFLGGSLGDYSYSLAIENGYAYIAGLTVSTDFPTTTNALNETPNGGYDLFVAKIHTNGQALNYSTYLGGTGHDYSCYIAVEDGYAYITGEMASTDFPTTVNAFDSTYNGGIRDSFVSKLNQAGDGLVYSTILGGSQSDNGNDITVDNGFAIVTGETYSSDYPALNGYDTSHNGYYDAFVTKVAVDGQSLIFSTFFGGSDGSDYCKAISLDSESIYITGTTGSDDLPMVNSFDSTHNGGWDIYVARLTSDGQNLLSSTFLGGSDTDRAYAIAVEDGYAYITGETYSTDYPLLNEYASDAYYVDCIVTKLSVDGQSLEYSTYLSGYGVDQGFGIDVENGAAYVTGQTQASDFPTVDAYNSTHGGAYDCFVSILSEDTDFDSLSDWHEGLYGTDPFAIDSDIDGHSDAYEISEGTDPLDPYSYPGVTSNSEYMMAYSSFLSGSSQDKIESIRVEDGFIYLSGTTASSKFPMVNAWNSTFGGETDVFIVKMSEDGQSLIFSTFVGGISYDSPFAIDVYDGCVFCAGSTSSPNFPTYLAYDPSHNGFDDGFLFKLASDGSALEFSTFLGGTGTDNLRDVCVEDDYAYVTGMTMSTDFPTVNAYDSSSVSGDAVVAKFAIDGQSLVYSTILGGDLSNDWSNSISVDDGFAYVGGTTWSSDFPMENPFDDSHAGSEAFLTKLSQDGSSLVYSTYIGGTGSDYITALHVDRGFAYLTGVTSSDDFPLSNALYPTRIFGTLTGFVAKMNTDGLSFVYSTYLAGTGDVTPTDIVTDKGHVIVTGHTEDTEFPTTSGHTYNCDPSSVDSFVTKFSLDGQALLYSTCFGGTDADYSKAVDTYDGLLYVAGYTLSDDYPSIVAYNDTRGGGDDGFVTVFDIDSDFDALPDLTESVVGTNPYAMDSDLDNFLDGYEFIYGSNPLDSASYPAISQELYEALSANLAGNASLIQNLITWSDGNASLIEIVMQQLDDNATLLTQVISWLDGNHTAIETLFAALDGNATLLMDTVIALNGNSTLIQNLLTWSAGNATLLQILSDEVATLEAADVAQLMVWMDGNHTAIENLLTYVEGNATLLLSVVESVNANTVALAALSAIVAGDIAALNALNVTHIGDIEAIREILDKLGVSIGDADYDGLDDLDELIHGTDPFCIDSDNDNLLDNFEIALGTDPLDNDSDADTYLDGLEVLAGTDPLDPLSYPGASQGDDPMIIIIVGGTIGVVGIVSIIVFKKIRRRS